MAVESEILLIDQEPGVEFEYHVIAVNKAGDGLLSMRAPSSPCRFVVPRRVCVFKFIYCKALIGVGGPVPRQLLARLAIRN